MGGQLRRRTLLIPLGNRSFLQTAQANPEAIRLHWLQQKSDPMANMGGAFGVAPLALRRLRLWMGT